MTYSLENVTGDTLLIGGGASNIGDEAILSGLLKDVNPGHNTITIVAHEPQKTLNQHKHEIPSSVSIRPMEPTASNLFGSLFTHDNFIVGGGGLFSRYMGSYSKLLPVYFGAAKALGKEVHWTALGVYESTPRHVMIPLKYAMNVSDSISVRDPVSKQVLERAGVKGVKLVPDPATMLQPDRESGQKRLEEVELNTNNPILGVAARRVMTHQKNDRLQRAYRGVIEEFQDRGWQIVLLPFGNHPFEPIEMDHKVCEYYSDQYNVPVVKFQTPQEMLGVVEQVDSLVATRLHSMIFAHVAKTPFVAVEYADKVSSLLQQYGHTDRGIPLSSVTATGLITILDELDRNR